MNPWNKTQHQDQETSMNRNYATMAGLLIAVIWGTLSGCRSGAHAPPTGNAAERVSSSILAGSCDLIVLSVTVTSTAARGSNVAYRDITKNLTNSAASSKTFVYLCTDTNSLSSSCLWTNHAVTSIPQGGVRTNSGTYRIPAGAALETNYVCAVANGDGALIELNSNNNTNCVPIIITQ
jgi:hypothetical protein